MPRRKPKRETIQQQLIVWIEASDMTQAELSRQTGIPQGNLSAILAWESRIESGCTQSNLHCAAARPNET